MVVGRRSLTSPSPWGPHFYRRGGLFPECIILMSLDGRNMPTTVLALSSVGKSSDFFFFFTLPIAASTSELIRHAGCSAIKKWLRHTAR